MPKNEPLIPTRVKVEKKSMSVRIDSHLIDVLRTYAKEKNVPVAEVAEIAFRFAISTDRDFQQANARHGAGKSADKKITQAKQETKAVGQGA